MYKPNRFLRGALFYLMIGLGLAFVGTGSATADLEGRSENPAGARIIGRMPSSQTISVDFVLPLRNQADLQAFLQKLATPGDSLYGHYLTPSEFTQRYGPLTADVDAVVAYAKSVRLTIVSISPNNVIIKVEGPAAAMETAFGVHLSAYQAADGTQYRKPDRHWSLPASINSKVLDVVGLDTSVQGHPEGRLTIQPGEIKPAQDNEYGVPGLSPTDTQQIYNLSEGLSRTETTVPVSGKGQTFAVLEFDGWTPSDITQYEQLYGLPMTVPKLRSVDSGTATPHGKNGASETTLDIDMLMSLAPNNSGILVYEADASNLETGYLQNYIDLFNAMATDDKAQVISVSYGNPVDYIVNNGDSSYLTTEGNSLAELASQGQTVCIAAGDSGAFADQNDVDGNDTLIPNVDDPGDQPNCLCVGGTNFDSDPSSSLTYPGETSWFDPDDKGRGPVGTGGGGGVSTIFTRPGYQEGAFSTSVNPQGSTTYRDTPDVSLYGDYDSGPSYSIYFTNPTNNEGGWAAYNGTSAASPLWAAFLGLADELRSVNSLPNLGLPNHALYVLGENSTDYARDYHDINDGSNNGYYNAVKGYDNSTGWGSFNGVALLSDLTGGWITGVSLSPGVAYPYQDSTCTVRLSGPAPSGGISVPVSLNGSSFTTVSIAAGKSTGDFSAYGYRIGDYNFEGTYGGTSASGVLEVIAPPVTSVTASSTTPFGGTVTGTVNLAGDAPSGGATVSLSSSDSSLVSVPSSVTVAGESTSATFTMTVGTIDSPTKVTITANYGGAYKTVVITVDPAPVRIVLADPTIVGGTASSGTVYVFPAAPSGNEVVSFSSSSNSVNLSGDLILLSGQSSATFTFGTAAVTSDTTATLSATANSYTASAPLTLIPGTVITGFTTSSSMPSGGAISGTVTLNEDAPSAGTTVTLKSSNPELASVPSSITVPSGSDSVGLAISIGHVTTPTNVTLTASCGGVTKSVVLTVVPVGLTLSLSEPSVVGGNSLTGLLTIYPAAPSGGVSISVSSSSSVIVPATVTVTSGQTTATFPIKTDAVTAKQSTDVFAAGNGYPASAPLTLTVAVPVISGFSPSSGKIGATVSIAGTSFGGATKAAFNGVAAASFTVISATKITATVPAGATSGTITVTTAGGTAKSANSFTVIPTPTVTNFSPATGAAATAVTVAGTNFTGATQVAFNGTKATSFTVVSDTKLTTTVPAGASTGPVTVTGPGGVGASSNSFNIIPLPAITSFAPASGAAGSSVTITGTSFTGASAVKFNGVSATVFTVVSATSVTATVPATATMGKISITTPGGTASSSSAFTVVEAPTIKAFSPTSGAVGTVISIAGTNFTGATAVSFNGVNATSFTVTASTKITVTIPSGATSGTITVKTPAGTATSSTSFTVD